jgi:hypothetical protein
MQRLVGTTPLRSEGVVRTSNALDRLTADRMQGDVPLRSTACPVEFASFPDTKDWQWSLSFSF